MSFGGLSNLIRAQFKVECYGKDSLCHHYLTTQEEASLPAWWTRIKRSPHYLNFRVQVEKSTPLSEVLLLLDSAGQTAALVLDDSQIVAGVLTRDRILAALEAESQRKIADPGGNPDGKEEMTVEMVGAKKFVQRLPSQECEPD